MAGTLSIALGVEGADTLKAALEGLGTQGASAMNAIGDAAQAAGAKVSSSLGGSGGSSALDSTSASAAKASTAFNKLYLSLDPVERASVAYSNALRVTKAAVDVGAASQEEANVVIALAKGRYDDVSASAVKGAAASKDAAAAQGTVADTAGKAADAHGKLSGATAGTTREFIVLGHEVISGNFSRIPGSLLVLAERSGNLENIMGTVTSAVTGTAGVFGILGVAAVAGLALAAVAAESNLNRLADLREGLRLTHTDYATLAVEVDQSAKQVAATSGLTRAAAEDIAKTIASSINYRGTAADLAALTKSAADYARVAGVDGVQAGKLFRQAIDDPAAAAKALAAEGLPAMNVALQHTIDMLAASGKTGDATALTLAAIKKGTSGAADDVPPLTKALQDLANQFTGAGASGKSFGDVLGGYVLNELTGLVTYVKESVEEFKAIRDYIASHSTISAPGTAPAFNPGNNASLTPDATGRQPLLGPPIAGMTQRATGIFQVLPTTGASLGYDVTNQDQNILAGLTYLNQNITKTGSVNGGLAQYGGYGTNVAGAAGYIGKVQGASAGSLPADIASQIDYWGQILGLPQDQIDLGKRMAVIESGGHQYSSTPAQPIQSTVSASAADRALAATAGGGEQYGPPASATSVQDPASVRQALAGSDGTLSAKQDDLDNQISLYVKALGDLAAQGTTSGDVVDRLNEKLAKVRGEFANAISPAQAYIRTYQDGAAAAAALYEGDKKVADVRQRLADLERANPGSVTPAIAAAALTAELSLQSAALTRQVNDIEVSVAAQGKLAGAYDQGSQAVINVTAGTQALNAANKLFPAGSAEALAATAVLTDEFKRQASAAAEVGVAKQNANSRDNLDYIAAETASVGLDSDARTKMLAVLKATQDMHRQFGDVLPKEAQDYVDLAGRTADATAAYQHQQQVLTDLTGSLSSMADTIGNDITQAFTNGEGAAVNFTNGLKAVETQVGSLFAKMLLINPLLNSLDGGHRSTISDVGGLLGNLLGGGSGSVTDAGTAAVTASTIGTSTASGVSSLESLGFVNPVSGLSPAQLATADNSTSAASVSGSSSGLSSMFSGSPGSLISTGSSLLKAVDYLQSGKLLSTLQGAYSNVSSFLGIGTDAAGSATGAAGAAAGAAGTDAATGAAGAVSGASGAASAVGSTLSTITAAAPYLADAYAVYQIASQFASGNTKGGIISLIGGSLLGSLFTTHPLSKYDETQLTVQDGTLAEGKTVNQVESATASNSAVSDYASAVNAYLQNAHVSINLNNGAIVGGVGDMFQGTAKADVSDPAQLFSKLTFKPDATVNPDSNLFKAESGALDSMTFADPTALQAELVKIATFTDNLDATGIKLASVGKDLTDIVIASVDLGSSAGNAGLPPGAVADSMAAVSGGSASPFVASDFRTALSNDLPGQTFANTDALDAEINKVNQFVNGTIPSLLTPVLNAPTQLQTSIQAMVHTYADAIDQAQKYGLATDNLTAAQGKAIALLQAPAIQSLDLANLKTLETGQAARGEDTSATQLQEFDIQAAQQRQALIDSYTNIWGSLIPVQQQYGAAAKTLDETLAAQRLQLQQQQDAASLAAAQQAAQAQLALIQAARSQQDAQTSVDDAFWSIRARQSVLGGDTLDSSLESYDAQAAKERVDYGRQLVDFYGQSFSQTQDYQDRMSELETVQQGERLAIIQNAGAAATAATAAQVQAVAAAQSSVGNVITSLTSYAQSLETGSSSPLSLSAQYDLSKQQFQAVQGAAAAGDYNSAQELQGYSQSFLSASRALNGSGAGYAVDYSSVLSAIEAVANGPSDALTSSAMLAATQSQTATLSGKFDELKAELVAVRRELQQQARAA